MSKVKSNLEVIQPSDKSFSDVSKAIENRTAFNIDYEQLAENYNEAAVGSIVLIDTGGFIRTHNVNAVIENRGLKRGLHFDSCKLLKDSEGNSIPVDSRPVAITKLKNKNMVVSH